MDKSLYRSKSLRLRSFRKDNFSKPLPRADSVIQHSTRRAKDDTVLGGVFPGDSLSVPAEPKRPSTAGGVIHRRSASPEQGELKVYIPSPPAVFFAAEVHTTSPLLSPKSPGKAITTDFADSHSACWPLEDNATIAETSALPCVHTPDEKEELGRPRLSRWKSFKGLFGKRSTIGTPPSGAVAFDQRPHDYQWSRSAPSRAATVSRATIRSQGNAESPQPPQRLAPLPPQTAQPVRTYTPSRGPQIHSSRPATARQERDTGFQGGYKYQRGISTVTTPRIDVQIPDIHLEPYGVMFGELQRTESEPKLLTRRQSKANRPAIPQPEALQTPKLPYLETKSLPSTPRSTAKYQLSLFPSTTSQHGQQLNPLGMHKQHKQPTLQRSQTSPAPRSPARSRHNYHPSAASTILSAEVPVRLELSPEDVIHMTAPPAINVDVPQTRHMVSPKLLTRALSSGQLTRRAECEPASPLIEAWMSLPKEPEWEVPSDNPRDRTSSQSSGQSTAFTAFSDETVVEQPVVQVSIARKMSVTRARSVKKSTDNGGRPVLTVMEKKSLTPTLVQLGHRTNRLSHAVEIEEGL